MKLILTPGKKILLVFSFFIFLVGFLMGNRYGESIPVLNQRLVPIYKVARPDNKISITLDGTWGADHTNELLEIFEENDIKVSFFFAGYWLEKYPQLVKKIAAAGHGIENHSYTHPDCTTISVAKLNKELEDTSALIEKLIGYRPRFFRPPFGAYNNQVIRTANQLGYQVVQWSLDSLDWQEPGVDFIVERILQKVRAGDIILMHNNAPDTPAALRILIPELKRKGFEIVPLPELIYQDNYYIESHSGRQVKRGE